MSFTDTEAMMNTSAELTNVLEELKAREPIFHRPEWGTTRADFERITAEDFWEVGASGKRYSRRWVLDELEHRYATPHEDNLEAFGFHCRKLGENVFLLTYTLRQPDERWTRRATIWRRTPADGRLCITRERSFRMHKKCSERASHSEAQPKNPGHN